MSDRAMRDLSLFPMTIPVLLLVVVVLATLPLRGAVALDLWSVRGLQVDVTAESAAAAQTQALQAARAQALQTLLQRLTRQQDWPRLPVLGPAEVAEMTTAFRVGDEKTGPDRYIATLSFDFQPAAIRRLLQTAGIAFTETRALPALVLPVLRVGGDISLWADPNPWLEAWARFDGAERLVPFVAPFGDVDDVLTISAEQAVGGDPQALSAMATRYRTESVLVADAVLAIEAEANVARIDIALSSFGPDPYPTVVRSFESTPDADVTAFMNAAVDLMVAEIGDLWKQRTIESFGDERQLSVLVPINGLGDWQALRDRIGTVSVVRGLTLSQMTVNDAVIVLRHVGDTGLLTRAMAQAGLTLSENDGYWSIHRGAPSVTPDATRFGAATPDGGTGLLTAPDDSLASETVPVQPETSRSGTVAGPGARQ